VLREDNYKTIIPSAKSLEDAIDYIKRLYSDIDENFPQLPAKEGESEYFHSLST
jgi:ASC-1-like (ASCH) protein